MWPELIKYLKDPYLVAKIQEFFGVKIHHNQHIKGGKYSEILQNGKNCNCMGQCGNVRDCNPNEDKKNMTNGHCTVHEHNNVLATNNKEHNGLDGLNKHADQLSCSKQLDFIITNYFWYYLFLFGTELGDETFYSAFIPFWFWNMDEAVGRKVVLVWAIVMSTGQALKDIICWPRPACPPAVRLQNKWSQEYGMPSTHAMVAFSIPFSVVLFSMNRYIYSIPVGTTFAVLWCTLVCTSRIYLGMHTVLDIAVGLLLSIVMMIPLVPLVDFTDYYLVSNTGALVILVVISIAVIIYYPRNDRWTPTRGDTAMVVSVTTGVHAGAWLRYKTGQLYFASLPPPYKIIWPSYSMVGYMILRTILGFCSAIGTKVICKSVTYATMCAILKVNSKDIMKSENSLENRNKIIIDLVYKFVTCFMIGINTVYLLPNVFTMIGIEQSTLYTGM